MYIHDPSALNVTSWGSYAWVSTPLTRFRAVARQRHDGNRVSRAVDRIQRPCRPGRSSPRMWPPPCSGGAASCRPVHVRRSTPPPGSERWSTTLTRRRCPRGRRVGTPSGRGSCRARAFDGNPLDDRPRVGEDTSIARLRDRDPTTRRRAVAFHHHCKRKTPSRPAGASFVGSEYGRRSCSYRTLRDAVSMTEMDRCSCWRRRAFCHRWRHRGRRRWAEAAPDPSAVRFPVATGRVVTQRNRSGAAEAAATARIDVDGVVTPARGIERFAVGRKHEPDMRVGLLQDLHQRGGSLALSLDVVEKHVLRRVGRIDGAIRPVERVMAGGDDGQRGAVRTERRANRLPGDEVRVGCQPGIEIQLDGVLDGRGVIACPLGSSAPCWLRAARSWRGADRDGQNTAPMMTPALRTYPIDRSRTLSTLSTLRTSTISTLCTFSTVSTS